MNISGPTVADVLIVDDDKEVVSVLHMYCENLGFFRNIITAKDGAEATIKLSNQKFAIILLDINMPKKSGVDIVSELEKTNSNKSENVIVVSGELNKDILTKTLQGGVKHFLVKPFDEEAFKEKVMEVLKVTNPQLVQGR